MKQIFFRVIPKYRNSPLLKAMGSYWYGVVLQHWCVRYYRIDKNNTRTIPVPRSRSLYDVSGLDPLSNVIYQMFINWHMKKGIGNVKHISTPWYWNCSCVIRYPSDSTLRTSIFTYLPISSDCCRGYRPETSFILLLLGTGIVLVLLFTRVLKFATLLLTN